MNASGEEEDIGAKYGNQKLNTKVRTKDGKEMRVFTATEASGTLTLRCEVCSMTFFGLNNLDMHINGRRHRSEMDVFADNHEASPEPEPERSADTDTLIVPPERCMLLKKMEHYNELPVVGLEYMVEIQKGGHDPDINCLLCEKNMDIRSATGHVVSSTHRLRYLECFFPTARRKFAKVPNLGLWQRPSFDFLESVVRRIEDKHGRLKPLTVDCSESFVKNLPNIKATVENGVHLTETDELNFASLPDPFGSYINNLPIPEVINISSLPDPKLMPGISLDSGSRTLTQDTFQIKDTGLYDIEDPEMKEYYRSEIEKFRGKEKGSRDNTELVMSKIAILRKEISNERKISSYRQSNKEMREKNEGLDDISDEEFQLESNSEQLQGRLRKPQSMWKGMQSRNPGDSASRKDKDDRENSHKDRDVRDNSHRDRDDREKAKHRDRLLSPRGRDRDKEGRERDVRDREERDRDIRDRDRNRRDRDARRSPIRRSRSREKERKRPRSVSPYVTAMENFKKFKKEEKVMLDGINRKKEIYDKRPEDHPKYPEEWRLFWEKRYKELLVQGKDPNTHDFKSEWIPFWTKRVIELFDVLVLEKTADLLKKYDLTSVEEPKRQDFKQASPERPVDKDRHRSDGRSPRKEVSPAKRDRGRSPSPGGRDRRGSPSPSRRGRRGSASPGRRDRRGSNSPSRRDRRGLSPGRRDGRGSRSPGRRDLRGSRSPGRRDLRGSRSPGRRDRRGSPRDRRGSPVDRRVSSMSPGRRDRRVNIRNPSPPHQNHEDIPDKGRTGPGRLHSSHSLYSGLTALEDKRDRGRSRSPIRYRSPSPQRNGIERGHEFHRMDDPQMGLVKVIPCLRLLTALEDSLGSLGPQVNSILAKAISLEQGREGASKVLLEDPDTVSIIDMIKEKLSGQMAAGLLEGSKEGAVRVCLDNLARLLQNATRKRSLQPTSLLGLGVRDSQAAGGSAASNGLATDEAIKGLIAKSVATVLIESGKADITDYELHKLIEDLMKVTASDDPNSSIGKLANVFATTSCVSPLKPMYSDTVEPPKMQPNIAFRGQDNTEPPPHHVAPKPKESFFDDSDMNPRNDSAGPAYVTPIFKADGDDQQNPPEPADELDDLTIEELRSLLDNFKNLSKSEQMDLIQYMRKLEVTNPAKVKQLKTRVGPAGRPSSNVGGATHEGDDQSRNKSEWSPSKRSRKMSDDDRVGMNPTGPAPAPPIEVVDMELEGDTLEDEEETADKKNEDQRSQLSEGMRPDGPVPGRLNEEDRHSHLSAASGGNRSVHNGGYRGDRREGRSLMMEENGFDRERRPPMNSDMAPINTMECRPGMNSDMAPINAMERRPGMNSDLPPVNPMERRPGMNSDMPPMNPIERRPGMNSDMPPMNPMERRPGMNSDMPPGNPMERRPDMNSDMAPMNPMMRGMEGMRGLGPDHRGMGDMGRGMNGGMGPMGGMNRGMDMNNGMGRGQIINPMFAEMNRVNMGGNMGGGGGGGGRSNGPWGPGGFY